MTSLQLANCSMFVPRRRETLGRRQWRVVHVEGTSTADVDDDCRRCRPEILVTG